MSSASELEPTLRQPAPALGPRARRTIEQILDATRETFLTHGYGGTSIDDITTHAGVSRASFYTYFPSKRDALLALGREATRGARDFIAQLDDLPACPSVDDFAGWLRNGLAFMNTNGSIGMAWTQAAHEDAELRDASMKTHLHSCALLGAKLNRFRSTAVADDRDVGLVVFSMLERTWALQRLYEPTVTTDDLVEAQARMLHQLVTN